MLDSGVDCVGYERDGRGEPTRNKANDGIHSKLTQVKHSGNAAPVRRRRSAVQACWSRLYRGWFNLRSTGNALSYSVGFLLGRAAIFKLRVHAGWQVHSPLLYYVR